VTAEAAASQRTTPAGPSGERISVIIPARNAAATIGAQLEALSRQTYHEWWEVIVVDNDSRDATAAVARSWAGRLPCLRLIDASGLHSPGYARNAGCRASQGELLLFCDADDIVDAHWVAALAKGLRDYPAIGGRIDRTRLNDPTLLAWRPARMPDVLPGHFGFLPYAQGANCGVRRWVWEELGGFDESLRHSEDVEFFWRAQLAGHELGYLPLAVVSYRYRASMGATVRQSYGYGKSHAQLYKRFAAYGMPRPAIGEACRTWWALASHAPGALRSRHALGAWLGRLARSWGRLVGSLHARTFYL
jgi:glycosyltransferase involved in cell wall biosynthesis